MHEARKSTNVWIVVGAFIVAAMLAAPAGAGTPSSEPDPPAEATGRAQDTDAAPPPADAAGADRAGRDAGAVRNGAATIGTLAARILSKEQAEAIAGQSKTIVDGLKGVNDKKEAAAPARPQLIAVRGGSLGFPSPSNHQGLLAGFLVASASINAVADPISKLPECSASRTNETCKLVVDRRSPLSPSTLQLYSGQHIVVIVKGALWTERYFLDYGAGQAALKPEVGTLLAQSLISPLGKLQISLDKSVEEALLNVSRPAKLPWEECEAVIAATTASDAILIATRACVGAMSKRAAELYSALEPLSFPDTVIDDATAPVAAPSTMQLQTLQRQIDDFVAAEAEVSAQLGILSRTQNPALNLATLLGRLAAYQKLDDTIAGDLLSYSQRLGDLLSAVHPTFRSCRELGVDRDAGESCAVLAGRPGPDNSLPEPTTRSMTYTINVLNLVSTPQEAAADSSKKRSLASVVVNFGGDKGHFYDVFDSTRWDGSVGLLFSSLPNRSFSVAPVFMNGAVTDNRVNETKSLPTPVPFVAVNYRLTNDLPLSTWKTNLYVTGLAGINPNTSTTDFGAGLSVSWRTLMLSVIAHFAHDTELTQGFTVNQDLGSGFGASLPTRAFWTTAIAVGISVRIPSLTGR
jgi:hypothetical protein